MSVTLDLKTLLIALVLIALIVLIIYVIILVKRLMVTLTHTDKVLEDVAVKGNESTVSAIASIAKSAASIKGIMSGDK